MNQENLSTPEVEKTVIGHLIQNGNEPVVVSKLSDIKKDYFFGPQFQKLFLAIRDIIEQGGEVSVISVKEKTKIKASVLTDILRTYCSNLDYNIKVLKNYADRRWLVKKIFTAQESIDGDILKIMTNLSSDIVGRIRQLETEKTDIKELIGEFISTQDENYESVKKGGLIGIPFGYSYLDDVISGIRAPHYIVIKADTSVGKSAFSLNIISNVLNAGKRVVLFSLEMSKFQNIARILGIRTNLQPLTIEKGEFKDQDIEQQAKDELYKQDLTIYENKRSINDILTAIHAEHAERPVDVVVVDYLQNISIDDSRYESYTMASQKLQSISKELNIPIIAASQVSKEGKTRGSGDIENHADFLISLQKGDNPGDLESNVVKNRHGMLNYGKLKFTDGGGIYEVGL